MSRRSHRNEVRVGILLVLALGVFTWLSLQVGALRSFGHTVEVTVAFEDAAGVVPDSAVKVSGVTVGGVKDLRVDFDHVIATLVLQKDAGLRNDVRAEIRARSLLGEKYVALVPKSKDAPLLVDGDQITDSLPALEINDLMARFGPLLEKVDPNDIATIARNLAKITDATEGEAKPLLNSAKDLLAKLNEAADIAPTVKEEVPSLIASLQRTVERAESTMNRLDRLMDEASKAVEAVEKAANQGGSAAKTAREKMAQLEPGLDDLTRALEDSDEVMAQLKKALKAVEGFDEEMIERLLREEGVLIRLKPKKADPAK